MTTVLRLARPLDAYPLWLWANDPVTRAASGDRPMIGWADHLTWFQSRLDGKDAILFVADEGSQPVGTIRFETTDGWRTARLSYGVAPEARGRGVASQVLALGIADLIRRVPTVEVEAWVRASNVPSIRLFRNLKWPERAGPDGQLVFRGPVGEGR